jgi:hypothetical protein
MPKSNHEKGCISLVPILKLGAKQECKTTVQRNFKNTGPLPLVVSPLTDREHALSRRRQNKLGCLRGSAWVRGASMIFSCSEIQSAKMRHFYFPASLVVARHTYFKKRI